MNRRRKSIVIGVTVDFQLRYHDGLDVLMAQNGWDVHVVSSGGPVLHGLGRKSNVITHVIPMRRRPSPLRDIESLVRWMRLLMEVKPRVVMVGTPKASMLGMVAACVARVPTRIYVVHGLRLEGVSGLASRLLEIIERLTCRLATNILPVSNSLGESLVHRRLVPSTKATLLGQGSPNGVDIDRFQRARNDTAEQNATRGHYRLTRDFPLVIFVGRLNEDKGLSCLARAAEHMEGVDHAQLLIVGPIDDESGHAGLERLRQSGWDVRVAGEVHDVAPLYAIADAMCLPSKREGLPTVLLEAFASGVPVVATAATGIVDLVKHEETGLLVEIDDHEALGLQLVRALTEPGLRRDLAKNGLKMARDSYARGAVQTRLVRWIESL